MQFTIVLSATRSRKPRGGGGAHDEEENNECCGKYCCGIDAWGIALNILLQDAPFLAFRLLIIIHYEIISYMNVFFTCKCKRIACKSLKFMKFFDMTGKNTLVILLQLYRLYVVHSENHKYKKKLQRAKYSSRTRRPPKDYDRGYGWDMRSFDSGDVFMISTTKYDKQKRRRDYDDDFTEISERRTKKKERYDKCHDSSFIYFSKFLRSRKDTGYSTASSNENRHRIKQSSRRSESAESNNRTRNKKHDSGSDNDSGRERRARSCGGDKKRHKVHPISDEDR